MNRRIDELLESVIATAIALGRRQVEEGDDAKRGGVDDAAASLRDAINEGVASRASQMVQYLSNSRRERIATAAMTGLLAYDLRAPGAAALDAARFADALIAELDKGVDRG